ncbi:hypothetical protein [Cryobacterium sp. PH29-G1]|uniref:hypothetical protein n=1 Tax=Cryobacterium sp. PH29-G1 TaxID=3046211 RepID=UPI0024BAA0B3|nr:hypothetical protein [Cryobacterium sp. PH29-G1]MDJ0347770.1 hypothetical protein [Cryobacterium sp. PH29-G1]
MQISKLERRILMVIAVAVVGILAVIVVPRLVGSGSAVRSATTQVVPSVPPSATVMPTPTPAATPVSTAQTEQQLLDSTVDSTVTAYSALVCENLQKYATLSISEIISTVLADYPTTGLSEQSRQVMAQRVLSESAAASCPDQSARVAAGIAPG